MHSGLMEGRGKGGKGGAVRGWKRQSRWLCQPQKISISQRLGLQAILVTLCNSVTQKISTEIKIITKNFKTRHELQNSFQARRQSTHIGSPNFRPISERFYWAFAGVLGLLVWDGASDILDAHHYVTSSLYSNFNCIFSCNLCLLTSQEAKLRCAVMLG